MRLRTSGGKVRREWKNMFNFYDYDNIYLKLIQRKIKKYNQMKFAESVERAKRNEIHKTKIQISTKIKLFIIVKCKNRNLNNQSYPAPDD